MVLDVPKKIRMPSSAYLCVAVFAVVGRGDNAAELPRHGLHAVTDPENWNAKREDLVGCFGRICSMHTFGAARENNATRAELRYHLARDIPRKKFRVDTGFTNSAGDQLAVLGTKIQDQDTLTVGIRTCACTWL